MNEQLSDSSEKKCKKRKAPPTNIKNHMTRLLRRMSSCGRDGTGDAGTGDAGTGDGDGDRILPAFLPATNGGGARRRWLLVDNSQSHSLLSRHSQVSVHSFSLLSSSLPFSLLSLSPSPTSSRTSDASEDGPCIGGSHHASVFSLLPLGRARARVASEGGFFWVLFVSQTFPKLRKLKKKL